MEKVSLVLGASHKPERFSNRAIRRMQELKYPVIAIGLREDKIGTNTIMTGMPADIGPVHTIVMYLNPANQKQYYDYILSLRPSRIIFNPGTINPDLAEIANKNGIVTVNDCALVMLNCGRY